MLGDLSNVEKIYIRTGYTDMRKQLNGLVDLIRYNFKLDPYSNSLFLFCGRRADRIKAVHYMKEMDFASCINGTKAGAPMAEGRRESKTNIRAAAPLASGRIESRTAKSGSKMASKATG